MYDHNKLKNQMIHKLKTLMLKYKKTEDSNKDNIKKTIVEGLTAIEKDKKQYFLLETGNSGNTILLHAVKNKVPIEIIKKILAVAETGNILQNLLEIKDRKGKTACVIAYERCDNEIKELLINTEQKIGTTSYLKHNNQNITLNSCPEVTLGEKHRNTNRIHQICVSSVGELSRDPSEIPGVTVSKDGSTLHIENQKNIYIGGHFTYTT